MPSLFAGAGELICSVLEIQGRPQLNSQTLHITPLPDDKALHLLRNLYEQMAGNIPRRIKGAIGEAMAMQTCDVHRRSQPERREDT